MPRTAPTGPLCEIRALRRQLQRSQTAFAALLGVSAETYRTWDSGRRAAPESWLDKARALAAREDPARLWSLEALAAELGVHVRTLRDAARTGRLEVVYAHRVVFGHLVPRATRTAGRAFVERYYKQSYSRTAPKPTPPQHTPVPADWAPRLRQLRADLGLTQTQLAQQIGAAGKAVVYQWEARKRRPSPVFWTRIEHLRTSGGRRHRGTDDREPSNRAPSTRPAPGPLVLADLVGHHPRGPRLSAEERGKVWAAVRSSGILRFPTACADGMV